MSPCPPTNTSWHHAPLHRLEHEGIYMVTAGNMAKTHFFDSPSRLNLLQAHLFEYANDFGWQLQAWAIFANHYHFIAKSPEDPKTLSKFLGKLHMKTAKAINELDKVSGRKVWHQFWDTHITYGTSYWARLRYVMENPVKHGLVNKAIDYPWCSARWFQETAEKAVQRKLSTFKIDQLEVYADF